MLGKNIVKLLVTLLIILSIITFIPPERLIYVGAKTEPESTITYNILGYSNYGTAIKSYTVTPKNYHKTVLLTFAMHGFEDAWDHDGSSLVEIGTDVFLEFSNHPEELYGTRLIVIPCVNPDGTWYGQSSKGFGRGNAQGIDINRDFDYYWNYSKESKYRTGNTAFSTPEAQILRDVVLAEKPDIIIDFHGWLNCTYGDAEITNYFNKALGIQHQGITPKDNMYMQQFFAGWASQYARTVLVEYPNPITYQNMLSQEYSQNTIQVIKKICSDI